MSLSSLLMNTNQCLQEHSPEIAVYDGGIYPLSHLLSIGIYSALKDIDQGELK